jgi:hypothetical protein
LARIEARIDKATPPRRTTTAPNPGTTLNGSNTPPAEVSMQELAAKGEDASEYIKRRRAQWAKGEK